MALSAMKKLLGLHPASRELTQDFTEEINIVRFVGFVCFQISIIMCAHCRKLGKLNQ